MNRFCIILIVACHTLALFGLRASADALQRDDATAARATCAWATAEVPVQIVRRTGQLTD